MFMNNDECLPYEKEAMELLHRLKRYTTDERELEFILSGVIDDKEAILELTTFIDEGEGVDLDSILDYAYYLCKDD